MKWAVKYPPINIIVWIVSLGMLYLIGFPYYRDMMHTILIKGPVYKNSSLNIYVYLNYIGIMLYIIIIGSIATFYMVLEWHEFRRNEKLRKRGQISKRELEKHESRARLTIIVYLLSLIGLIAYEIIMLTYYNYQRVDALLEIMINEIGYFLLFYGIILIIAIITEANVQSRIPDRTVKGRS
jgi:magnesium-transporting ATPase (P-type)